MSATSFVSKDVRIVLGDPVPFGDESPEDLLLKAAAGSAAGTRDPVDLALIKLSSHHGNDVRSVEHLDHRHAKSAWHKHYSLARVRSPETGSRKVARGRLRDIERLCHTDHDSRREAHHAEKLVRKAGFRPLAIAECDDVEGRDEKDDDWRLLGIVPVRATRRLGHRSEEPSSFRYVNVWDWQMRWLHWVSVLSVLVLCATGYMIGTGRFVYSGPEHDPYFFGYLRLIHFIAAWLLIGCGILRFAGLFLASNRYQTWSALFPLGIRDFKNGIKCVKSYLFISDDDGPHYVGHNPLQQFAYTFVYLLAIAAILTGFALYALYEPDHWFYKHFLVFVEWFGIQYLRWAHMMMLWAFLAFIPVHVYLAIRADTMHRDGAISSIFSGGRYVRRGVHFEDLD